MRPKRSRTSSDKGTSSARTPSSQAIVHDRVRSMILWGPPGVGKTTIGRVIRRADEGALRPLQAVLGASPTSAPSWRRRRSGAPTRGADARFRRRDHRFNKSQQDAFLPHVEDGTITLVGATTENPSFAVNAALLSRCKVYRLELLDEDDLVVLLSRALHDKDNGLGARGLSATTRRCAPSRASRGATGGARSRRSTWRPTLPRTGASPSRRWVARRAHAAPLRQVGRGALQRHERVHQIDARLGPGRGALLDDADARGGRRSLFLLRRMLIFASEDIGNADARALLVVAAADHAFQRMGMPEGMYHSRTRASTWRRRRNRTR